MNIPDFWELASVSAKFLHYLGILASSGLVLVRVVFARETRMMQKSLALQATAFALLGLFASVFGFALKGAALTGEASGMIDPAMLGLLWETSVGSAFATSLSGIVLILAGIWIPRVGVPIAAAGGILALFSFARVGHMADMEQYWLSGILMFHLASAAFWIGILSPLRSIAGKKESLSDAAGLGRRFGRIAAFSVPLMVAAGFFMAWQLLGDLFFLVTTSYGLTLLAKIGLVSCLLAAAAANKLRFVPAMEKGDRKAAFRLRRSIAVEWVALCLIILATAVLTTIPNLPSENLS